jgi:excisionase family DNA binding protein
VISLNKKELTSGLPYQQLPTVDLADLPEVMTLAQAATVLQISENTARALAQQKVIPAIKVGNRWRVPRVHLTKYLSTAWGNPCQHI